MARDYVKERRDYYGYGKYEDQTDEQKRHRTLPCLDGGRAGTGGPGLRPTLR